MMLTTQKRIAAGIFRCSPKKVHFDEARLAEIKEAITRQDIKSLISEGVISRVRSNEQSRSGARFRKSQRLKGRQRGHGSRKGSPFARVSAKRRWIGRIRLQREFLKALRLSGSVSKEVYRELYLKAKGGFFRSRRHLELYVNERGLMKK
ncbi:50S ribosomal protein L19e [Candidatus Woesearchaeota archaeon]|nr:50S ribosomal protein L19e [Candidatus Woesearchaeota archaeon]